MSQESESLNQPRPRIIRSLVLIVLYVAMVVWAFHGQSTSWPHEGSWSSLAYWILCPGIVFQSFVVFHARLTGRMPTRRVLARLITVPLGLVIAAFLGEWASGLSMDAFERAYAPFVAQVGASLAAPCSLSAKYFAIPVVAAYNAEAGRNPTAILKYNSRRFVLSFSGGSFDMDGSTIYFDSGSGRWRKFHNDSGIAVSGELDKLTDGLAACKLRSMPEPR